MRTWPCDATADAADAVDPAAAADAAAADGASPCFCVTIPRAILHSQYYRPSRSATLARYMRNPLSVVT